MSCEKPVPASAGLPLPVLGAAAPSDPDHAPKGPRTPRSTMGRRRAVVLGVVQLLMVVHVVQWLWTGTTIRPIEPSESMETAKDGIVTVGTVFFALALLSTALLGRWFCGWGCHVVLLQDLCGWAMKRVGVRPRLLRSRLLLWLPLSLACYMFLWPVVYRFAIAPYTRPDLRWPGFTAQLVTDDFWATFPGWLMGIPFLLVCGFATVYLLGAKGYCTYACPYGGFFTPLDELSPVRVRASDACTQCGHCTAVCTSNVRVHEEVRDFGMVVDPGCMKCLDCVSACPEDALRIGFGTPAFLAKPRGAVAPPRRWDLSWNEEIAFAAIAVLSFFAVRGAIGVPLLFAAGIAVCATGLAWFAWQALSRRDARLHRLVLRRGGRTTAGGAAVVACAALVLGGIGWTGALNTAIGAAEFLEARVPVPPEVVFSGNRMEPEPAVRARAEQARRLAVAALPAPEGYGFDGPWVPVLESRIAWLDCVLGDYAAAEARLEALASRVGATEFTAAFVARARRGAGDLDGAIAYARAAWEANPGWESLREEFVGWMLAEGRRDEALAVAREAVARRPDDLNAMRRLSLVLVESDDRAEVAEGIALVDRTLEIAPGNAFAHRARAVGLRRLERYDEAEADLRRAISLAPGEWRFMQELGEMLMATDRVKEAMPLIKQAGEMRVAETQGGR
ncbi:MAG: hypothetical protein RIS86_494 [Planctomycetota bacterium]|jgi:tetratricopeptide (TPR) repeat protein/NAD-dependent dihydropyrimidine dehydrogenase PreA subunit